MIIRSFALIVLGIVLSGCFTSADAIWPVKSGERVSSFSEGLFNCITYDEGVPEYAVRTITSASEGANLYYIFEDVERSTIEIGSFHKIVPGLYVLVTGLDDGRKFYNYVRISDGHAVIVRPSEEQRNEYATKHGITFDAWSLDGDESIERRRNFLIDLGKNLKRSFMTEDCSPA